MSSNTQTVPSAPSQRPEGGESSSGQPYRSDRTGWLAALSFRNISAVYIFIAIFIVFALWVPETFLAPGTWWSMLDSQAVTALAALGVLVPMIAGQFNLAIGAEVGIAGILAAAFIANLGLPVPVTVLLTLTVGALIGLVTALLITKAKIASFIATLGMSSVLLAGMAGVSNSQQILNLGDDFRALASTRWLGLTLPVYIVIIAGLLLWYVLERTAVGRRVYATGFNPDAARLSGVATQRVIMGTLMAGGVLAASAGILLTSRVSAGDPTLGPSLLLPAFTAVFLGSTQFRGGRFNVWGTLVAVVVLAAGIKGLQLVGAPIWITELFNGLALLLAVGLSKFSKTSRRAGAIGRLLQRKKSVA